MSKYGKVAVMATEDARKNGEAPWKGVLRDTWNRAAQRIFPNQESSQEKSCPLCAFLGLAEDGFIKGIPPGQYIHSTKKMSKQYAILAVEVLREMPYLCDAPRTKLWDCVMQRVRGRKKAHNNQMDVVIGLWKSGYIEEAAHKR